MRYHLSSVSGREYTYYKPKNSSTDEQELVCDTRTISMGDNYLLKGTSYMAPRNTYCGAV